MDVVLFGNLIEREEKRQTRQCRRRRFSARCRWTARLRRSCPRGCRRWSRTAYRHRTRRNRLHLPAGRDSWCHRSASVCTQRRRRSRAIRWRPCWFHPQVLSFCLFLWRRHGLIINVRPPCFFGICIVQDMPAKSKSYFMNLFSPGALRALFHIPACRAARTYSFYTLLRQADWRGWHRECKPTRRGEAEEIDRARRRRTRPAVRIPPPARGRRRRGAHTACRGRLFHSHRTAIRRRYSWACRRRLHRMGPSARSRIRSGARRSRTASAVRPVYTAPSSAGRLRKWRRRGRYPCRPCPRSRRRAASTTRSASAAPVHRSRESQPPCRQRGRRSGTAHTCTRGSTGRPRTALRARRRRRPGFCRYPRRRLQSAAGRRPKAPRSGRRCPPARRRFQSRFRRQAAWARRCAHRWWQKCGGAARPWNNGSAYRTASRGRRWRFRSSCPTWKRRWPKRPCPRRARWPLKFHCRKRSCRWNRCPACACGWYCSSGCAGSRWPPWLPNRSRRCRWRQRCRCAPEWRRRFFWCARPPRGHSRRAGRSSRRNRCRRRSCCGSFRRRRAAAAERRRPPCGRRLGRDRCRWAWWAYVQTVPFRPPAGKAGGRLSISVQLYYIPHFTQMQAAFSKPREKMSGKPISPLSAVTRTGTLVCNSPST